MSVIPHPLDPRFDPAGPRDQMLPAGSIAVGDYIREPQRGFAEVTAVGLDSNLVVITCGARSYVAPRDNPVPIRRLVDHCAHCRAPIRFILGSPGHWVDYADSHHCTPGAQGAVHSPTEEL